MYSILGPTTYPNLDLITAHIQHTAFEAKSQIVLKFYLQSINVFHRIIVETPVYLCDVRKTGRKVRVN